MLIIIIIGLIIYFVWSAIATPAPETPSNPNLNLPIAPSGDNLPGQNQNNSSSTGATPTLTKISENPVFDYWVDLQTQEIYYLNPDGQVFSAKKGADLQITQQKLSALNFIELSPSGQRVLAAFGDPRLPQWGIFDTIDKAWRPLPDNILNATWAGDSNTLIGFIKNDNNINLSTVGLTQGQPTYKILVKDLRLQDISVNLLTPNNLIISEKPSSDYPGRVWNLNTKDLSIHQLFSPENGLTLKTSRDKKMMFVFSKSGGFRMLNAATLSLTTPVPFSTLPSKCSPDSTTIYCFVPADDGFKNANLPDDYFKQKIHTQDTLYKIDIGSDDVSLIPLSLNTGAIDAKNPLVNSGMLYFINQYDNSLYSLNL